MSEGEMYCTVYCWITIIATGTGNVLLDGGFGFETRNRAHPVIKVNQNSHIRY